MRVIAYSIRPSEKEPIAVANERKHDITLISNPLTERTVEFAKGKKAVIVNSTDKVSEEIIRKFSEAGVKFIATRSSGYSHIDLLAAKRYGMRVGNVAEKLLEGLNEEQVPYVLAAETISNLDKWQNDICIGPNCKCPDSCKKDDRVQH